MTSVTKYANTITQTSGSYATGKSYRTWQNKDNLKGSGSAATCGENTDSTAIGGKNGTWPRPSTLTLTNFGFNIPSTAKITSIKVGYSHGMIAYKKAYGTFTAPTITLQNVSGASAKGSGVGKSLTAYTKTFNVSPSVSSVNSSKFGVKINYPANSSTNPSRIQLKNVYITVTYTDYGYEISSSVSNGKPSKDETVNITLKLTSKNNVTSSTTVNFTLPSGLGSLKRVSGNGTISNTSGSTYAWKASFSNQKSASVTFSVKCTSVGTKTITFTESSTNVKSKASIVVSAPNILVDSIYEKVIGFGQRTTVNVFISTILASQDIVISNTGSSEPNISVSNIVVTFPSSLTIHNVSCANGTYVNSGNTYTFTPKIKDYGDYISFDISQSTAGVGSIPFTTKYGSETAVNHSIKLKPSELSYPYYSKIILTDDETERMGNSKKYTITSMMNVTSPSSTYAEDLYDYNYRMGVFNTNLPNDADEEYIFENTVWSDPVTAKSTWEELSIDFHYSEDYPVIILFTGEYLEGEALSGNIQFTYPCVKETAELPKNDAGEDDINYKTIEYGYYAEEPGLFFYKVKDIVTDDSPSTCIVPSTSSSNPIRCYNMGLSGLIDEDDTRVVQGITVEANVNTDNPCSLLLKLVQGNKEGSRSININEDTNEYVLVGDEFDLWGLDYTDFTSENIEDIELEIIASNPFTDDVNITISEIQVTFYYIDIQESIIKAYVNGVDLRYYNIFIKNVKIPAGTNNDVKYLEVEGTDSNLAYRSNIQSKEIEIEFRIPGCDIVETSKLLERLAKLLSNERDKFNKPLLNTIEFNHFPDRIWYFLMEDAIDAEAEFVDYEGKIKLVIPAGTSFSKTPQITNASGTNDSIAKVNPEIRLVASQASFTINESVTDQKWELLSNNVVNAGDIIRLDCENRVAYKLTRNATTGDYDNTDITSYVDFNSDWFIIHQDYNFQCEGAMIQEVTFNERW